ASVTVKDWKFDVPPPGAGLPTVTLAFPSSARAETGTVAVNRLLLTNFVGNGAPFQNTVELLMKFVPSTGSGRSALPSGAEVEPRPVVNGTGLLAWFRSTDTLSELKLAKTRSGEPSPSKSPTATACGAKPVA